VEGEADPAGPRCASRRQNARGNSKSPPVDRKYGLVKRALDVFNRLMGKLSRKPKPQAEYIEIVPSSSA